jgi:uncharacterized protein DUF4157
MRKFSRSKSNVPMGEPAGKVPAENASPRGRAGHPSGATGAKVSRDDSLRDVPDVARPVIDRAGTSLDSSVRASMESGFGHDFSHVRVHADESAAASAKALNAKAFAFGHDIVFGRNRYQPGSSDGRRLLAHELAHVVQQTGSSGASAATHAAESEASSAADSIASGKSARVALRAEPGIQREPDRDEPSSSAGPKVETRPRFDQGKAARAAQQMVADYNGKLIDEGGGLVEVFNRSGNLYDSQKRRSAAGELGALVDYLEFGAPPDGRPVKSIRVIPSRNNTKSPDAHIKFADGGEISMEIRTITSAPGIRKNAPATTVNPTVFPDGKTTQGGLVDATQAREPTVTALKEAIREKAVTAVQLSTPQQETLPSGQSRAVPVGGDVVIDIPFGMKVNQSMIDEAMKDMKISPNVKGILFKYRVTSASAGTSTVRIYYSRNGSTFTGRVWDAPATARASAAGATTPRATPSGGAAASEANTKPGESGEHAAPSRSAPAEPGKKGGVADEPHPGGAKPQAPKETAPAPRSQPSALASETSAADSAKSPGSKPPPAAAPKGVTQTATPPKPAAKIPEATPKPVPETTPFGRSEGGAPSAPRDAETDLARAAGRRSAPPGGAPAPRLPAINEPDEQAQALGGGILLVLDLLHAALDKFADEKQRNRANTAWEQEYPLIQKEITRTGRGVVVYFEYTSYGESTVLVYERIYWSSVDSGPPAAIRAPGEHASFLRAYVGPTHDQASKSVETALLFRRNELRDTQRVYQESAEDMAKEGRVGRLLRKRAGNHIDPKLTYDAKAHIASAGEAIKQKRFGDATRSLDMAQQALDQMLEQFRAYMGPGQLD